MNSFIDLYKAIEIKTGLKADGIVGTYDEWVAELPNGNVISSSDFTVEEIENAKTIRENEEFLALQKKLQDKAILLKKLGITEDEAKLLLQ